MATHTGPVKRKVEAVDFQTDVTDTYESKRARFVGPDTQGNTAQCIQHQSTHPNDAVQSSRHHGAEISTSIHCLPSELMAMIFSQLNCRDKVRVACVCSWWHDLIDIPSVWRDYCPHIDVNKLTSEHIKKMCIRMIRKVKICYCDGMERMTTFLQALPHLKNLYVYFPLSLTGLYPRETIFPSIQHFSIYNFTLNTGDLHSILQPMVNLQDLRLECIPEKNILCALNNSKHLVSLFIKSCSDDVEIAGPSTGNLNPILSLKHLTLRDMTVGDSGLDLISRAFPQLHTLELRLSHDVTSDGLAKLAKLKELRNLKIRSGHLAHNWMEHLHTEQSLLENLSLHGCKHIKIECFQSISKMPALRVLRVPFQDQEVEGLYALSRGCSALQTLILRNGNQSINQGLKAIKCMPYLQELILDNCAVNDDFWQENSKSFSNLRKLSFIYCQLLSEQCLLYVSQMDCLERLLLRECRNIKNESIRHLGETGGFKALTSLVLINLGIKDQSLSELSKITPFLKELEVVSCDNLTENGLAEAVSNLPQLRALKAKINTETKHRLENIRPHLQFLQ